MELVSLYGTLALTACGGGSLVTGVGSARVVRSDIVRCPSELQRDKTNSMEIIISIKTNTITKSNI